MVDKLTKHKTDAEKLYLLGLFFPEKLKSKNIPQVNPFPIPTYTFTQTFTLNVTPNAFGNFVCQVVCPHLGDTSLPNTQSSVYVCTDPNLNGYTMVSGASAVIGTQWTAYPQPKIEPLWFNSYVLLFAKCSAQYFGN